MRTRVIISLLAALMLLPTTVLAQSMRKQAGAPGWGRGPGEGYARLYDLEKVETMTGEVISVEYQTRKVVPGEGIHLRVRFDDEIVPVHLGPKWFLDDQDWYVGEGDTVTVTGSRVQVNGEPFVLAAELKKGDDVIKLRDDSGRPLWAASGRGGGWGRDGAYQRMYDPKTVETVTGEVLEITYFTPRITTRQGIHLKLKSGADILFVHLGPRWFIENQDILIFEGDTVTVKGSRITFEDRPAIIAASVQKGDDVLMLRDDSGFPVWAGWKRRSR